MKRILITLSLLALCWQGNAQTNTTPPTNPEQTFFQSVGAYFTSFNSDLNTFHKEQDRFDIIAGPENQQGVGITAVLAGRWNFYRKGDNTNSLQLSFGGAMRNADIAGTILSEEGEFALSLVKYDTKLTFGTGAGYSRQFKSGYTPLFAEVTKALTPNTFAGLRITHDFYFKGSGSATKANTPKLLIVTGFTF